MITAMVLNPAVDKIYFVENFRPGGLYRVKEVVKTAGGKGINVARVASVLGEEVSAVGFKAGETGNWLEDQLKKLGVCTGFVEIDGESRVNNNIIDRVADTETEVLEIGPEVDGNDIAKFIEVFETALEKTTVLVCSGGLPRGVGDDFYRRLIERANTRGIKTILDTSGDILIEGVKAKPYLVKPNLRELSDYAGCSLEGMGDVVAAARRMLAQGVKVVLASLGKEGAVLVSEEEILWAAAPDIKVVNTIGSGDSMVAGFAAGIARGLAHADALRLAMACAANNAQHMEIGYVDRQQAYGHLGNIRMERLKK